MTRHPRERRAAKSTVLGLARTAALWIAVSLAGCAPRPTQPTVASCSALPLFDNDMGPDAVALLVRTENKMRAELEVIETCISIDGRSIRQDAPGTVTAAFAAHRPLEVRVSLRPGVAHVVQVVSIFAGRGALEGNKLMISSHHDINVADLRPGVLLAEYIERDVPALERRFWLTWTASPAAGVP